MARALDPEEARVFDEAFSAGQGEVLSEEAALDEMLKTPNKETELSPLSIWLAAQLSDPSNF